MVEDGGLWVLFWGIVVAGRQQCGTILRYNELRRFVGSRDMVCCFLSQVWRWQAQAGKLVGPAVDLCNSLLGKALWPGRKKPGFWAGLARRLHLMESIGTESRV